MELLSWADPPLPSLPVCSFFYFPPVFPPPFSPPSLGARAWTQRWFKSPLCFKLHICWIGRWICNHICSELKSTPLLFSHPLDPWPSSFLHLSEFLPICSLLEYLDLHNSKLCSAVCDFCVHLSPWVYCNLLEGWGHFSVTFCSAKQLETRWLSELSRMHGVQLCLSSHWQSITQQGKDDFRGAVTSLQKQGVQACQLRATFTALSQQWYLLLIRSHRITVGFEEEPSLFQGNRLNCNYMCNVWSLSHSNGDRRAIWEGSLAIFFLAIWCSMPDLSSLTRNWTHAPWSERVES